MLKARSRIVCVSGVFDKSAATEAHPAPQIVSKSPNQENTFIHHNPDPLLTKHHDSSYSTACLWKSSWIIRLFIQLLSNRLAGRLRSTYPSVRPLGLNSSESCFLPRMRKLLVVRSSMSLLLQCRLFRRIMLGCWMLFVTSCRSTASKKAKGPSEVYREVLRALYYLI